MIGFVFGFIGSIDPHLGIFNESGPYVSIRRSYWRVAHGSRETNIFMNSKARLNRYCSTLKKTYYSTAPRHQFWPGDDKLCPVFFILSDTAFCLPFAKKNLKIYIYIYSLHFRLSTFPNVDSSTTFFGNKKTKTPGETTITLNQQQQVRTGEPLRFQSL